ncbi:MAG: putative ATP-dependent helicase [Acidimicrobiales bacterium]|nr:putative ATP-dependent helicase [Acidimicrobiales bacterium]
MTAHHLRGTAEEPLVDAAERDLVERSGLRQTLFVEAGAGTGKTHELVQRVVHLVTDEQVPLAAIAAITFTEAAAAELRDRIREQLERRLAARESAAIEAACQQALEEIDEAAIGTLHGFALRILSEHPLDIGLPPRVDILDEVSSQLAFEERWEGFVDELYDDPAAEELILRAWALGVEIDSRGRGSSSLKDVAAVFEDSWDRLAAVAAADVPPLPPIDVEPLRVAVADLRELAATCVSAGDKLLGRITDVVLPSVTLALAETDPLRTLRAIAQHRADWKAGRGGATASWPDPDVQAAKAMVNAVGEAADVVTRRATDEVLRRLTIRLARFTVSAAEARRAEGRLDFHDLLVLARRLVRTSPSARATLHHRYQRLLLDEFQDTDPIQIEVAVLIAGAIEEGEIDRPWADVAAEAGRLFFVGDPKQSIYRFRRADIGLFLRARDAFSTGAPVVLRQNFRTIEPILAWVNDLFGRLMPDEVDGAQPRYHELTAQRVDGPVDHRVVLLGGALDRSAGELRQAEAAAVAAAVASVRDDPDAWLVHDTKAGQWRHPRMSDVTILVPTRTSLRQLEDALEIEDIPYRVATGTLVYDTQEVREVLDALRAIDDPGDSVALVSALRSPLYACSDRDLLTFVEAGGRWDLRGSAPTHLPSDHPVVAGLAHLRSLWLDRWWLEPSALLERLLRERQAFALAFSHRRPREVWRRLRFIVDQARSFTEAGGGGLRRFLKWADLQRSEGTRVHEPLQAETDDDAVSILTIHGAKGLEFPITIVSGTTTEARAGRRGVQVLWRGDEPEVRLRKETATTHFDRLADIEAEMDVYERARLLYVACTRARDHLVVSMFHKPGKPSYGAWLAEHTAESADRLSRRLAAAPEEVEQLRLDVDDALQPQLAARPSATDLAGPSPLDDRDEWLARRHALLDAQREPHFVSATAVALGAAVADAEEPEPDDEATPVIAPRRRGRAGTAIGRAVHATLQLVAEGGADLDALAAQQADLEAVPDDADTVARLARSALGAPSVQAAHAASRSWRELYVAAPIGTRAIEGYIDLLYETADGLVIVDYKTDTVSGPVEIDAKAERYALQLAAYAVALESSTGLTVVDARLVFCQTGDAVERTVPNLAAAKADVRRRVGRPEARSA